MSDYLPIGSFSHGTLRPEDLASAILDIGGELLDATMREELEAIAADEGRDEEYDSEVINDALDALQEYAPPYCYVGAHEGDGSDFGVWPCIDQLEEDARNGEVIKVSDLSEVETLPRGDVAAASYVMLVSDHGNVTLYPVRVTYGAEIWGIV